MLRSRAHYVLFFFLAIFLGCSAGKESNETGLGPKDSGFTLDGNGSDSDDPTLDGDLDAGPGDGSPSPCAAVSKKAETAIAPVDIIWVVDSSGSMKGEAARVQENLNDFSAAMGKVGIDYHVVMITSSSFVKVPPPLGTSPSYMAIDRGVGSNEPLQVLLDEFPKYKSFLRPLAITHFIEVTDDESKPLTATDFLSKMKALLGHDFTSHAIASEEVPISVTNPTGACVTSLIPFDAAAAPGKQYYKLADLTLGKKFSICTKDWTALFATLTSAIAKATAIPCSFLIPPPPDGSTFDKSKVNVEYTDGTGKKTTIFFVPGGAAACPPTGGWYYDDDSKPTKILLCPATCTSVSADKTGKVDIAFGCATRIK